MTNRLLIVDDEKEFGAFVAKVALGTGFKVKLTSRPQDFKEAAAEWKPTLVALDLQMPEMDGIELLRYLAAEHSAPRIVIMSGVDGRVVDAARRVGLERGLDIAGVITKPVRAKDLKALLEGLRCPTPEVLDEAALAQAIANGDLFLQYQPKVSLRDGTLVGVEALVRWRHSTRGLVSPNQFVPLAEESGLIDDLSRIVLTQAIIQQRKWAVQGLDLQVAINLSPLNLRSGSLADDIAALCLEHTVPPERITIEITETAAMDDALQALDTLTRLRLKGFKLSIDDFGTGFSSLTRLQRLPATEIKVDQSFVRECTISRDALAIVKTVIDLARNMELTSVAEGIETDDHYRIVAELGCDLGQGYGIGKPMMADDRQGGHARTIGRPR
jgi:EAL domain-containing protein (putative c-di-GMP-specific phosphodiesterase class I)